MLLKEEMSQIFSFNIVNLALQIRKEYYIYRE